MTKLKSKPKSKPRITYNQALFQSVLSAAIPECLRAEFPPRPNGGSRITLFKGATQVLDAYHDVLDLDDFVWRRKKLLHHASIYIGDVGDIIRSSVWSMKSYRTEAAQIHVLKKLAAHLVSLALLEAI